MSHVIDKDGVLLDPDFHDGELMGMLLSGSGELKLVCRTEEGESFSLLVPSLVRLRANDFLEGNIILEVAIHQGRSCSVELVKKLYDYNEEHAEKYLSGNLKEIADKNWTLIEISSSYGCELIALSGGTPNEIRIERGSEPSA